MAARAIDSTSALLACPKPFPPFTEPSCCACPPLSEPSCGAPLALSAPNCPPLPPLCGLLPDLKEPRAEAWAAWLCEDRCEPTELSSDHSPDLSHLTSSSALC
eukprot:1736567-Rhodomonas_salina.1